MGVTQNKFVFRLNHILIHTSVYCIYSGGITL